MRRNDKAVVDPAAMAAIIRRAVYCHLALSDEGQPYCVPLCFGYRDGVLYVHSAAEGRKLAILEKNPRVCVVFVGDASPKAGTSPCDWTMTYESVVGVGTADIVADPVEKRAALALIAAQYDRNRPVSDAFPDAQLRVTTVLRVTIETMTGKRG